MKYPVLRCAIAALLLSGAPSAHALEDYWYTGLGVGYSRVQFFPVDFSSNGTFQDSKKDFDAGFKAFIGYQINRNWAAELSYATVGKFHYKRNNGSITEDAVYKVTGVGFSLVPTVPQRHRGHQRESYARNFIDGVFRPRQRENGLGQPHLQILTSAPSRSRAGLFFLRSVRYKPRSFQSKSTRLFTSDGMAIGRPQAREVSAGHLFVASIPIFEPRPETGLAKSR